MDDPNTGVPPAWIAAIYGSMGVLCAAGVGRGVLTGDESWVLTGVVGFIIVLCTMPIALKRTAGGSATGARTEQELHEIRAQVRQLVRAIESLQETMVLSDDARRVLNRGRERSMLRAAIEEDIKNEDWDAAMVLIRELAERFGYRADAEEFRQKVETARFSTMDRRVGEALRGLEGMMARAAWDEANAEALRIQRVFPDSPKVEGLRHRVAAARDRHKIDLERRFLEAAQQERVDEAMGLLHELDQYLTEHEGERFREVARGVIGKARENLGAGFKLAIQDRAWDRAAEIGGKIIEEFPNSRIAQEVRELIDTIRERGAAINRP